MSASVNGTAEYDQASGGTASVTITSNPGDVVAIFTVNSTSGSSYPSAITDSNSAALQNCVSGNQDFGTYGSQYAAAGETSVAGIFWGVTEVSGSNVITVTFSASHSGQAIVVADCTDIANIGPVVSNIIFYNSATESWTVAGGSGSDSVGTVPALLVAAAIPSGPANWTTGSGWAKNSLTGTQNYLVESQYVTAAGTYDATATPSVAVSGYFMQLALAQAGGVPSNVFPLMYNRRNVLYFI